MVGDLMDLHVYALLKRKYNDLAESVEGLVDESAELTEEARKTLAEAQDKLDEIKPLLETSKDNVKISEEQIVKVQEMLDELEPAVADIEAIIKQALQNVHTGEYESDREYLKGNETLYNGSTYRALEDVTGVLPTDTSKWQLVAQRGVDGTGAVSSVNNIAPDENGNVDLGKITADWDDLEGKPEVLEGLGDEDGKLTYKGEEVGEKLVIGRKAYVADGNTATFKTEFEVEPNTNRVMVYVSGVIQSSGENFTENKDSITLKFTPAKGTQVLVYTFSGSETLFVDGGIVEEDIKHLETKEDATAKLEEAKQYTRTYTNFDNLFTEWTGRRHLIDATENISTQESEVRPFKLGSALGNIVTTMIPYDNQPGLVVFFDYFYGAEFNLTETDLYADKPVMKYRIRTPKRGQEVAPGVGIYYWTPGVHTTGWIDII